MPATGHQPPLQPIDDRGDCSAAELGRLQDRLSGDTANRRAAPLRPVTFRCYGAGAQTARDDESRVIFTFPVDHGHSVRLSASRETALEFADSLFEQLGGLAVFEARRLKRGCRR